MSERKLVKHDHISYGIDDIFSSDAVVLLLLTEEDVERLAVQIKEFEEDIDMQTIVSFYFRFQNYQEPVLMSVEEGKRMTGRFHSIRLIGPEAKLWIGIA